jgi:hypothetical protein
MALVKKLCEGDAEALDLLDQTLTGKQGNRSDLFDFLHNVQEVKTCNKVDVSHDIQGNVELAPTGNSAARALRRLRKDRPDLHARILAGELTPHGARGTPRRWICSIGRWNQGNPDPSRKVYCPRLRLEGCLEVTSIVSSSPDTAPQESRHDPRR